jgi:hypothetical protein
MSWADKVKATALATLAERTPTAARISVDTPWTWNPHEAWLTRVKPPRARVALTSMSEQANASSHQDTAPRN